MPSLVEIGLVVLEENILNFVDVFSLFRNYFLLKKKVVLHLCPRCFVSSFIETDLLVLENKINI